MISTYQQLTEKLSTLEKRERWMVFAAGLAVIYFALNTLLINPLNVKKQSLETQITQSQTDLSAMQTQMNETNQKPLLDVDADTKRKIEALNAEISKQNQEITELQQSLVSPQEMPTLLKSLMQHYAKLHLVSMKTLAVEVFNPNKKSAVPVAEGSKPHAAMYKHGLEFTIAGNYMDLLHFAEALKGLSTQLLWQKAVLQSKEYPTSELTITVYTLSLDKTWLSI